MLSAVIPLGFMGLRPDGQALHIEPRLPEASSRMTVRNLDYQGTPMDITVSAEQVKIVVHEKPTKPLQVILGEKTFLVDDTGAVVFPLSLRRGLSGSEPRTGRGSGRDGL